MPVLVIAAIVLIVLFAAGLIAGAARRQEMGEATGTLKRETLKRDRARRKSDSATDADSAPTGREVELAAVSSSKDLVSAATTAPTVWVPPDPETIDVTRRQFLNRSIVGLMAFSLAAFAAAAFPAFLWPTGGGGFGSKIRMGKLSDLVSEIQGNSGFLYKPEGRLWLVEYPESAVPKAQIAYAGQTALPGMEAGIVALYQKCPHLGCRVPECVTSQWFECPCHGSQYNRVGEKKGGPAPRGMDRFGVEVAPDGTVIVDTGDINTGPAIGINTTGQEAEGAHCISGATEH